MDYIKSIRSKIGHDPLILCVCGCVIINDKGQVLLQKRSDDGLWGNPGGVMELGETIYDATIREVKEETNLSIDKEDLELFNIYSGENQHHFYPNKDEVYYVNIVFKTTMKSGEIKKDAESYELTFFDLDKMSENVTTGFQPIRLDLMKEIIDE